MTALYWYLGLGGVLIVSAVVQKPSRAKTWRFIPTSVVVLVGWLPLFLYFLYTESRATTNVCGRCAGVGSYRIGPMAQDIRQCGDCGGSGMRRTGARGSGC